MQNSIKATDRFPNRSENRSLDIEDAKDNLLQFYSINEPYMILLETCREEDDKLILYQFTQQQSTYGYFPKKNLLNRPLHQHSFLEIMYVLSGQVENHVGNQVFTYSAGQCCVMNRNIWHREEITGSFSALFLMLQDSLIKELYDEALLCTNGHTTLTTQNILFSFYTEQPSKETLLNKFYLDYFPIVNTNQILRKLRPVLNKIVFETISSEPGAHYLAMGYISRFLLELSRPEQYIVKQVDSDIQGHEFLFGKLVHLMKASHGRCSRDELSTVLHYNAEYLNRIVKKYTGKTLSEYQKSIYLEEVCSLLKNTNKSISKIIDEMNFSNRSYFYKIFQETYGMTPQEYRQQNQ